MEIFMRKVNDLEYHGFSNDVVGVAVWQGCCKEDGIELKKRYLG